MNEAPRPDDDELKASMRRHPSASQMVDCPACCGLGKVTKTAAAEMVDSLVGRPSYRDPTPRRLVTVGE